MSSDPTTADALWSFSLAYYVRPGISPLCLEIQDSHGADVNVVLTLLFLATRGVSLDAAAVTALDTAGRDWRETVVIPLRGVRRRLKTDEQAAAQALRTSVKAAELEAERLEQHVLAAHVGPVTPASASAETIEAAAQANLGHYLAPRGAAAKVAPFVAALMQLQAGDA